MEHLTIDLDNLVNQEYPKPSPKCDPDYAMARVDLLMGAYRKADYHNVETFIGTLTAILSQYPPAVVDYVTDPLTGVQRRCKFPPTPAEVVEACAAEMTWRIKMAQNSTLQPVPRLPPPKFSATENYEVMFAKHGRPIGVFERRDDRWNTGQPLPMERIKKTRKPLGTDDLQRMYPKAELIPPEELPPNTRPDEELPF